MHIVIDKGKLRFLPIKHENMFAVCDLVVIEAPNTFVYVCPLDDKFLNQFTDLELMLLYKNTTGETAMRVGDKLRDILFEIAERIPVRTVNLIELSLQASLIPNKTSKRYVYNYGGTRPLEKDPLFALEPCALPANISAVIPKRIAPISAPINKPAQVQQPTAKTAHTSTQQTPKKGGVRDIIWFVADKMWEAQGKPMDKQIVLSLRKEAMGILEAEHGVKKTSSSNELGNWMKARIV